jgi:ethanolamine utilization microcompartment shell protein EutS
VPLGELLSMSDEQIIQYMKSVPQQISDPEVILAAALKIPKNKLMTKIYTEEELEASGMLDLKVRKAMIEKDIAKKGINKVGRFFSTKSLSISRRKVNIHNNFM